MEAPLLGLQEGCGGGGGPAGAPGTPSGGGGGFNLFFSVPGGFSPDLRAVGQRGDGVCVPAVLSRTTSPLKTHVPPLGDTHPVVWRTSVSSSVVPSSLAGDAR